MQIRDCMVELALTTGGSKVSSEAREARSAGALRGSGEGRQYGSLWAGYTLRKCKKK